MIGFVNIIKPTGMSSASVVNKIKHALKCKVGHLGTLDPMAAGVLPIAIGKATRFFDYFLNKDKVYVALARFGILTDTLDSEGTVIRREDVSVKLEDVKRAAQIVMAKGEQKPPMYSARSLGGVRGYEAARKNIELDLPSKKVQIYEISVEKWAQNNVFKLNIHCSAGTYVRSIVRDIALELNTIATTVAIIRTRSGAFNIKDGVTLNDFLNEPEKYLIKVQDAVNLPAVEIDKLQAKELLDGKSVSVKREDGQVLCLFNGQPFSVADIALNQMKNKIYLFEE